jgi:hypothetical protein
MAVSAKWRRQLALHARPQQMLVPVERRQMVVSVKQRREMALRGRPRPELMV